MADDYTRNGVSINDSSGDNGARVTDNSLWTNVKNIDGNSIYSTDEGTLTTGTTDQVVTMGSVTLGQKALISNDGSNSFIIKFNDTANNSFTIKAGEVYRHSLFDFSNIYLSNSSGSSIAYRIMIQGS